MRTPNPWAKLSFIASRQPINVELHLPTAVFGRAQLNPGQEGFQFLQNSVWVEPPKKFNIFWFSTLHFEICRLPDHSIAMIKVYGQNAVEVNGYRVKKNEAKILKNLDLISINKVDLFRIAFTYTNDGLILHYPLALVNRYAFGKIIGSGGQGSTRKIYDKTAIIEIDSGKFGFENFQLALKKVDMNVKNRQDVERNFDAEVSTMKALSGRLNIVHLFDSVAWTHSKFIVMECCDFDLLDYIQGKKFEAMIPSERENVNRVVFYQICVGIAQMHSLNIAHRDIKPENILVKLANHEKLENPLWIVKICDFGFSKNIEEQEASTQLGTDGYMSPQVHLGVTYDLSTDIWSAGCVLFELAAGFPPFHQSYSEAAVAEQICKRKINWSVGAGKVS